MSRAERATVPSPTLEPDPGHAGGGSGTCSTFDVGDRRGRRCRRAAPCASAPPGRSAGRRRRQRRRHRARARPARRRRRRRPRLRHRRRPGRRRGRRRPGRAPPGRQGRHRPRPRPRPPPHARSADGRRDRRRRRRGRAARPPARRRARPRATLPRRRGRIRAHLGPATVHVAARRRRACASTAPSAHLLTLVPVGGAADRRPRPPGCATRCGGEALDGGHHPRRQQRRRSTARPRSRSTRARCWPSSPGRTHWRPPVKTPHACCRAAAPASSPLAACGDDGATPDRSASLAHESFALSDDVLAAFTARDRHRGRARPRRGRRLVVNQAILTRDRPAGRRAVRHRHHVPHPRPRRGPVRAVPARPSSTAVPDDLEVDRRAPGHADRPRRRVRQLRPRLLRGARRAAAAGVARRPRRPCVPRPARRRGPGDLLARSRLPGRHRRGARRGRLGGVLGGPPGQRRRRGRRLDRRLLRPVLGRRRRARATGRSSCPTRRARRPRSCSPTRPSTSRPPA